MRLAKKNFSKYLELNYSVDKTDRISLLDMLEDFSMVDVTKLSPSDPNGTVAKQKQQASDEVKQAVPSSPAPNTALNQSTTSEVMSQEDFNGLPNAGPTDVIIKKGTDGKYYFSTNDPSKLTLYVPPSQTNQPQQEVAEAYDFMNASILNDDIVSPVEEPIIGTDTPGMEIKPIKIEVDITTHNDPDDNTTEKQDDKEYDMLANLPPLDLSNDIQKAVYNAQQGMMPTIRVSQTDAERMEALRDGPIGSIKPVGKPSQHKILPIESDPEGLSVVGIDNDLALKFM